jgi:hypothetical protein
VTQYRGEACTAARMHDASGVVLVDGELRHYGLLMLLKPIYVLIDNIMLLLHFASSFPNSQSIMCSALASGILTILKLKYYCFSLYMAFYTHGWSINQLVFVLYTYETK